MLRLPLDRLSAVNRRLDTHAIRRLVHLTLSAFVFFPPFTSHLSRRLRSPTTYGRVVIVARRVDVTSVALGDFLSARKRAIFRPSVGFGGTHRPRGVKHRQGYVKPH